MRNNTQGIEAKIRKVKFTDSEGMDFQKEWRKRKHTRPPETFKNLELHSVLEGPARPNTKLEAAPQTNKSTGCPSRDRSFF